MTRINLQNIQAAQVAQYHTHTKKYPIKKWAEDLTRHFSKDIHMVINIRQDAQHHTLREMQTYKCKSIMKYHLTPVRMAINKKSLQTINAGEGVEKREPSYTVGGNAKWYSHYGEQYGDSRTTTTIWPSNPTTGHTPWGNHKWKRHMYPSVHWSTIYNS